MCTEPETLAPIIATKADQVVLIGDHKQLQPIILCSEASDLGLSKSLFERYANSAVFLDTQYRMVGNFFYITRFDRLNYSSFVSFVGCFIPIKYH